MGRAGTRWRVLTASGLVALALHASPAAAQEDPPTPTTRLVTGPIAASVGSHDHPISSSLQPLEPFGYVEEEVFLEGTATVHGPSGIWRQDGKWGINDITESPYRTRLLVRRPADPARFNGTVVVSWLNVGAGFDLDPEWAQIGEELVRQGAAFVGVSAQTLGVEGRLGARAWDPQRYDDLMLSGDNLAYDIFSQAGEAIRTPGAIDPLEGLAADRRLIATGQSQSAQRLVTYINAFHPGAQVYDGFLLVSRYRGAAPLGNAGVPSSAEVDPDDADSGLQILSDPVDALLSGPPRAEIRSDTDVPVLVVLTETEAVQNTPVGREDSDLFRTWEVAGTSHIDTSITEALRAKAERDFPDVPLDALDCAQPNTFPSRYALRAAIRSLGEWVDDGTEPPSVPRLARDSAGELRRDADGNVLGGLRLPDIDVPTASYSGESDASGYCGLTGSTVPFTTEELAERYPNPEAYAQQVSDATADAVEAGHMLPEDAAQIVAAAGDRLAVATAAAATAEQTGAAGPTATPEVQGGVAAPPSGAAPIEAGTPAPTPAAREDTSDRGWMATTGRDLITPVLVGLLLLINGRVVLTVANQRRRRS